MIHITQAFSYPTLLAYSDSFNTYNLIEMHLFSTDQLKRVVTVFKEIQISNTQAKIIRNVVGSGFLSNHFQLLNFSIHLQI